MEDKIRCPMCDNTNAELINNQPLCHKCSESLNSNIITCPNCNEANDSTIYNCINCGHVLNTIPPEDMIVPNKKRKNLTRLCMLLAVLSLGSTLYFTNTKNEQVAYLKSLTVNTANVTAKPIVSTPSQLFSTLENGTTNNSSITLKVKISSDIQRVWLKISKDTQVRNQVVNVSNGILDTKIYLPFNSGEYKISVLTNNSKDANDTLFYLLKEFNVTNTDSRDMSFLLPGPYVESDSEEIIKLAKAITESSKTDMEKTSAIHDWIVCNIAYDTEAFFGNNIHEYSSLETLNGKKAICNGYANLAAALNRAVGIKAKVVSGVATDSNGSYGHAWNETYVDGQWIIQDTTWDAGTVDNKTQKFSFSPSREFFNPTLEKFSQTHTKEREQ